MLLSNDARSVRGPSEENRTVKMPRLEDGASMERAGKERARTVCGDRKVGDGADIEDIGSGGMVV
jgi:hypothetical protein